MKENFVLNTNYNQDDIEFFMSLGYPQSLARVLSVKGFTQQNFYQNMRYDESDFIDPMTMHGMSDAVKIIKQAMALNESILIFGDYDADGLSGSALLSSFFTHNGVDNAVIMPTRDEGYGMNVDKIVNAMNEKHFDLLITVDCGISNVDEVATLKEKYGSSLTIIVTDHHEIPQTLPDCICVNPKLGYDFPMLSGSGVAFKVVQALSDLQTALKYADIAIIGTIADIMPLTGENRTLVRAGLANFNHRSLKKLAELSKCGKNLSAQDIAMKIAPKINAAGRVGQPVVASKVLLAGDRVDNVLIEQLLQYNEERRAMTESITELAMQQCIDTMPQSQRLVFVKGDGWKHGIIGIVAGKLKEYYNLPAVVLTKDGDNYVGSARGIEGINLHQLFVNASQYLNRFGGHKSSVGFSVSVDNVENLHNCLVEQLMKMDSQLFDKQIYYDIALGEDGLTITDIKKFADSIEPLMPNNELKVLVKDYVKQANTFGKGDSHLSITLGSGLQVKAFFNYSHYLPVLKSGAELELLVTLTTDSYSGDIQAILNNIAVCNSLHFEEFYQTNFLLNFNATVTEPYECLSLTQAGQCIEKNDSVLCVFDDYVSFDTVCKDLPQLQQCTLNFFAVDNNVGKVAVVSPHKNFNYNLYNKVIIFTNKSDIYRKYSDNCQYVLLEMEKHILSDLHIDRDICILTYRALKAKQSFDTLDIAYNKYLLGKISYNQYIGAIAIMAELGLYDTDKDMLIDGKVTLNDSKLFCYFNKKEK